jgi:hypothetical protein
MCEKLKRGFAPQDCIAGLRYHHFGAHLLNLVTDIVPVGKLLQFIQGAGLMIG